MIDHEVRFIPASQAARDHMRKGSIGALKAVYVRVSPSALVLLCRLDTVSAVIPCCQACQQHELSMPAHV